MRNDRITGEIVRFSFEDGPMAGKTFEHSFGADGTVKFRQLGNGAAKADAGKGDAKESAGSPVTKYEVEAIRDDVSVVSYRSGAGYTLTTVLDFTTNMLVAFASNEKMLVMQHGTFEVGSADEAVEPAKQRGLWGHASH